MTIYKFDFSKIGSFRKELRSSKFKDFLTFLDIYEDPAKRKHFDKYWKFIKYFDIYIDDQSDLTIGKTIVESWKPISQVELAKRLGINRDTAKRLLAGHITTYQNRKLIDYVKSRSDYKYLRIWFNGIYMYVCVEAYIKGRFEKQKSIDKQLEEFAKEWNTRLCEGQIIGKGSVEKDE